MRKTVNVLNGIWNFQVSSFGNARSNPSMLQCSGQSCRYQRYQPAYLVLGNYIPELLVPLPTIARNCEEGEIIGVAGWYEAQDVDSTLRKSCKRNGSYHRAQREHRCDEASLCHEALCSMLVRSAPHDFQQAPSSWWMV
jgi:hypothetical protein